MKPMRSSSMIHPTPIKTLLTTTFESLVTQLSGLLAQGTRLLERFIKAEPTPATTMAFERALSRLLREVGRRIMAWAFNRLEPEADDEAPSRVVFEGRLYRRRRKHPHEVGTLFGPVTLWRRLYEPRGRRGHAIHPLELRLGIEAGLATPTRGAGRPGGALDRAGPCFQGTFSTDAVGWPRRHLCAAARGCGTGRRHGDGLCARPTGQARGNGVSGTDARIRTRHPHRSAYGPAPGDF